MKTEIDFALTTYCQAKCRSCARTNDDTGEKEEWLELRHMNFEIYRNIVTTSDAFKNKDDVEVTFCGEFGDPMMHPQVEDFIRWTAPLTNMTVINTNGGLRQPEWYAKIAEFSTTNKHHIRINFGIDGIDHDTNWKYREGVDWERAMANMTAWFQNGGHGEWQFLIFDWNWHQIPEAQKMADDLGITIRFKLNTRNWGKVQPENMDNVKRMMELIS